MKQRCLGRTHVLLCCLTITRCNFMGDNKLLRDWSKSMGGGGGGPEQRGGGSSVFEPLVRGGSCNF